MDKLLVKNARVYQDEQFARADVLCEDALIAKIGENLTDDDARIIDAGGMRLAPGFIDVHTHGAAGVDVNAADEAGLRRIAAFFATQGVTAFNASVLTDTPETTEKCLGAIANVMSDRGKGAQLLGAHLEGPFLAKEYKGAMPEYLLREGDENLLRAYQNKYPGVIRYITVSPEVPGVVEMIGKISHDVVVAIGHSGADYDTSMEAIRRGARCVTHTLTRCGCSISISPPSWARHWKATAGAKPSATDGTCTPAQCACCSNARAGTRSSPLRTALWLRACQTAIISSA